MFIPGDDPGSLELKPGSVNSAKLFLSEKGLSPKIIGLRIGCADHKYQPTDTENISEKLQRRAGFVDPVTGRLLTSQEISEKLQRKAGFVDPATGRLLTSQEISEKLQRRAGFVDPATGRLLTSQEISEKLQRKN